MLKAAHRASGQPTAQGQPHLGIRAFYVGQSGAPAARLSLAGSLAAGVAQQVQQGARWPSRSGACVVCSGVLL